MKRQLTGLTLLGVLASPAVAEEVPQDEVVSQFVQLATGGSDPQSPPSAEAKEKQTPDILSWSRAYPTYAKVPESAPSFDPAAQDAVFDKLRKQLQNGAANVETLQRFVRQWPDHLEARLWLVRELLKQHRLADAQATLQATAVHQRDQWQVLYWQGTVHLLEKDFDAARAYLTDAQEASPESVELWIQQAAVEQEYGNHAGAVQLLEIAQSLDPDHMLVHLNMAYSLEQLQAYEQAVDAYQRFMTSRSGDGQHLRAAVMRRIAGLASLAESGR